MARKDALRDALERMTPEQRQKTIVNSMGGTGITGEELLNVVGGGSTKALGLDNPGIIPLDERLRRLQNRFI